MSLNRFNRCSLPFLSFRVADLEVTLSLSSISTPIASSSAWTQAYVGLPYVLGTGECAHRAALVWREQFGIEVEVAPAFGDMDLAQRRIRAEIAGPDWFPVRRPMEGDAVVMWKGDRLCHIGIFVAPSHVLHCTRRDGMVLTPEPELPAQGFRVFGYFRKHELQAMAA